MKTWLLLAALAHAQAPAVYDPAWTQVLAEFVDETGRVDFAALAKNPQALNAQAAFVAKTRPESFKDRKAELAYLLNAYNALAMRHAALSGLKPKSKIRFFYLARHDFAGQKISLHALENDLIRPMGDARIHFALNCMVRGCPRLPREPFSPEGLDAQLNASAMEFFSSARHVQIDDKARTVRFSSILKWYEDDFLASAPGLIPYANRYREQAIPLEYGVEFLPYDWELNQR